MTTDRMRIIVLGYLVRGPLGGLAWHHLQYVLGLARLGHDVYFAEESDDYPSCYNPITDLIDTDPTYGLEFARSAFARLELADRWAYYDSHTGQWLGPAAEKILDLFRTADLLLNCSGANPLRDWHLSVPTRALIDTDPVFTQIRHLTDPRWHDRALRHTVFFTYGQNLPDPQDDFPWQPTRQPVVLDVWRVTAGPRHGKFSTVMLWESYPAREYQGVRYGMKSASFDAYLDLPERVGPIFDLALGSPNAPRALLQSKGWTVLDPREATRDPWRYQEFIRDSKAEFGVAKHGYVVSQSGWFSERSAAYLASGRPVLVQDTGFSRWLEEGAGVIPFTNLDEAVAGVEAINSRYEFHCRAARAVAEEYFDARVVLPYLIERAMNYAQ